MPSTFTINPLSVWQRTHIGGYTCIFSNLSKPCYNISFNCSLEHTDLVDKDKYMRSGFCSAHYLFWIFIDYYKLHTKTSQKSWLYSMKILACTIFDAEYSRQTFILRWVFPCCVCIEEVLMLKCELIRSKRLDYIKREFRCFDVTDRSGFHCIIILFRMNVFLSKRCDTFFNPICDHCVCVWTPWYFSSVRGREIVFIMYSKVKFRESHQW